MDLEIIRGIDDPLVRYHAAVDAEQELARQVTELARLREDAIAELYEQQGHNKNLAALGRQLRLSRERVRAILDRAGRLDPTADGRRKAHPAEPN